VVWSAEDPKHRFRFRRADLDRASSSPRARPCPGLAAARAHRARPLCARCHGARARWSPQDTLQRAGERRGRAPRLRAAAARRARRRARRARRPAARPRPHRPRAARRPRRPRARPPPPPPHAPATRTRPALRARAPAAAPTPARAPRRSGCVRLVGCCARASGRPRCLARLRAAQHAVGQRTPATYRTGPVATVSRVAHLPLQLLLELGAVLLQVARLPRRPARRHLHWGACHVRPPHPSPEDWRNRGHRLVSAARGAGRRTTVPPVRPRPRRQAHARALYDSVSMGADATSSLARQPLHAFHGLGGSSSAPDAHCLAASKSCALAARQRSGVTPAAAASASRSAASSAQRACAGRGMWLCGQVGQ
jgi:hypothetical protein